MASLHTIFQDLALIISDRSDMDQLRLKLETSAFDWEKIVPVASSHLIIPLIYCRLKEKGMLQLLPEDLRSYLAEITSQNRDRNKTILKEVKEISAFFDKNKIDHVFLKGAALLASGIYKDIAERMVGDIDILVHPDQLFKAHELLTENGYDPAEKSLTDKFFEQKHLPRLIPKNKLTAIEIHRRLIQKPATGFLEPIVVLNNKNLNTGINIPTGDDLLLHSILNFEINDLGYYFNYLGLRNVYDMLILLMKLPTDKKKNYYKCKFVRSFIVKLSCYFEFDYFESNSLPRGIIAFVFLLKQKHQTFNKLHFFVFNLINVLALIFNRIFVFFSNTSYRRESYKKRGQILKFIRAKIQP